MTEAIIQRIERFAFPQGGGCAERRHRGDTLTHAATGAPVARLRPDPDGDYVEVLYWSLRTDRWSPTAHSAAPSYRSTRLSASSLPRPSSGRWYEQQRNEGRKVEL